MKTFNIYAGIGKAEYFQTEQYPTREQAEKDALYIALEIFSNAVEDGSYRTLESFLHPEITYHEALDQYLQYQLSYIEYYVEEIDEQSGYQVTYHA